MKKLISTLLITTAVFAVNNYNQFQKQVLSEYKQYNQNTQNTFVSYQKSLLNGFKKYKEVLNKGFKEYKKSLAKYWINPELSTKTTFVEYSTNKKIRKKVDYKNNYIQIDVIAKNKQIAKKEMAKSLYSLSIEDTTSAFEKNPVLKQVNKQLVSNINLQKVIKVTQPSKEPIVEDMIFKKPPTQTQVVNYAIKNVKNHKIITNKSKLPNMKVYTLKIKLPSNSLLAKAKIYKTDVFKRASQFRLTPEFIYAIIHTESSFNPMARSYIPAFGLMQIVPSSAGADAYKMLTGKKKILAPSYLYNAHNNILIGSAYLNKIYYGYMRKIKNPISRLYCSIAAYNTGAGNVACAFNSHTKDSRGRTICRRSRGDYNIIKASDMINTMSSKEVYNHLLSNLRYDEPKNYLKRVTKRIAIYDKVIKSNDL